MTEHLGARVPDTTPYPWPFDGDLGAASTAVLVVSPPWDGPVDGAVLVAASEVAAAIEAAGGSVISLHTAPPPSFAGPDHSVGLPEGKHSFTSHGIDGFYGSGLEAHLRKTAAKRLVLVGLGAETSVHSTMRTANDMGFECLYVADACQPYDPELAGHAVSMIEMSGGIFGAVGMADAVVAAYTERT